MKKNTVKLLAVLLALSVAVALGSVIALANASEAVTPEVISKNVSFDDNLHIYFAVRAEGIEREALTLRVFEDKEGEIELQTPRTPAVNPADGSYIHDVNGTPCYIFRTLGIAPKEIDKTVYVQPVNTVEGVEQAGEIVGYSIHTYLNEMLYKRGFVNAASGKALVQKELYLNTLDYCSNAQDLFLNYNDTDSENDVPLFNEYNYVYAIDGSVDGKEWGLYLEGTEATLTAEGAGTKQWEVTEYLDGVATVSTLPLGAALVVKAPTTLRLVDDAVAAMKGIVRFDTADEMNNSSLFAMKAGLSYENGRVKLTADGTSSITERLRIYPTGTNTGMDTAVFEADIFLDNTVDELKSNGIIYLSPLASTTSGSTAIGTKISLQTTASKNQANVYLGGASNSGSSQVGTTLSFRIRYTYQYIAPTQDTAAKAVCTLELLASDGSVLQSVTTTSTSNIKTPDECLTFEMCANSGLSGVTYIDNVCFYQTGNKLAE